MYRESLRSKWREVEKVYVREDQEYSNNVFMKKVLHRIRAEHSAGLD